MPPELARPHRLANLWRIRTYVRPYRGRLIGMLVAHCLGVAAGIAVPLLVKRVVDGPLRSGDTRGLAIYASVVLAVGVGEAALQFIGRRCHGVASVGIEYAMRNTLYNHLQRLPVAFHDRWQSGQLVSRATSDLSVIRRFLSFGVVFLLVSAITYVAVVAVLIRSYWQLGLLVAAGTVPLLWISIRFERQYLSVAREIQDRQGDVATFVEESAVGIRAIKSFGRRRHMSTKFDVGAQQLHEAAMRKAGIVAKFWPLYDLIPITLLAAVVLFGARAVNSGQLTLGTLVSFVTLTLMLVWPVDALGWLLAQGQQAMTAADRVYEVLDTEPTILDRPGAITLTEAAGRVRFEGVGFTFPDATHPVLRDVDLTIEPGQTLAIVGVTGSGKSTLTALVPRLYDVTAGRITLDGHDIRDLALPSLRQLVSMAFEDATLFSASVRENLTLGRPDASDADVDEALHIAQAEFARDLPWGLDTRIGEQGMTLSGGQRQRLALARAVLGRPRVLVLDDPLSALDVRTESLVEAALRQVLATTTALLVVHRPSTVALADRVALLRDGTIAAVGTHSELMATEPAYRDVLSALAEEVPAS